MSDEGTSARHTGFAHIKSSFARALHGYAVLQRIEQISGGALLVEQGALYPALFRLVRQGLLKASWGTSENNRRAKFYELTAKRSQTFA